MVMRRTRVVAHKILRAAPLHRLTSSILSCPGCRSMREHLLHDIIYYDIQIIMFARRRVWIFLRARRPFSDAVDWGRGKREFRSEK